MNRVFDITDFGAVGDGQTDDTAAVQAALDAASECKGLVRVPPGEYAVGRLQVKGCGVVLEGVSGWGYRHAGASLFKLNTPDTDCMLDISGAFGFSMYRMSLYGGKLGKNVHAVKQYWDEYNGGGQEDTPTIDDCRISCFSGDGLHFEHVWAFTVRHCLILRNLGAGIYIDGWDGFVLDCWLTANGNGGVMGGPVAASITLTGNRVEWNPRGGFIFPNGNSYNITGNFFDRSFGPALEMGGETTTVDLVTVTGNIFRRSGAHGDGGYVDAQALENKDRCCHLLMRHCSSVAVTGNAMRVGRNDGGSGEITPTYGFVIEDCEDCVFKDNTMHNGATEQHVLTRGANHGCVFADNVGNEPQPSFTTQSALLN